MSDELQRDDWTKENNKGTSNKKTETGKHISQKELTFAGPFVATCQKNTKIPESAKNPYKTKQN